MQRLLSQRAQLVGFLLAVALMVVSGCSSRPKNVARKVAGKVTLGGQPLAGAAGAATGSGAAALPEGRLEPQRALRWPRIGIYHRDAGMRFALKASPTVRRLRARAPVA